MKIIFMGTPQFGVPTLEALCQSEHKIMGVFTQRPKAKGRGMGATFSPIHVVAEKYGRPVYTPSTLKTQEIQSAIDDIDADIIIVAAYGFIIPKLIVDSKKYGCLNIHPSDLPRFRGAAPLQHTIIEGDRQTSICVMQMDEGLDTGDIILKQDIPLSLDVTYPELHNKTSVLGAKLLLKALDNIELLPRTPQNNKEVKYAPKLSKLDGKINWHESANQIERKIRGMNPWPGTFFEYNNSCIKVLEGRVSQAPHAFTPGMVIDEHLSIACGEGILRITKLQRPGKKPMDAMALLKGFKISVGTIL